MGVVKKLLGGIMGSTPKPKAQPVVQPTTTEPTKSAAEVASQEEEARRKRLLALNAQGSGGQMTSAAGDTSTAPVARKTLLGQ